MNKQTKRDNMVAVKREEARNPIGERMDRRIARKQQEMRRDAIANGTEEKRGPIKGCKRTDAQCKPCQESWDILEQGPSSSMTTIDNRVGRGTRRGGCNVLY
jgi:hypothetical protein